MAYTIGENLWKILEEHNPWWKTGKIPEYFASQSANLLPGKIFSMLTSQTINKDIMICGIRKSGKTAGLYHLINLLLSENIDPRKILFISYSHPLIKMYPVQTIVDIYKGIIHNTEDYYLFIDEIEYAPDSETLLSSGVGGHVKTVYASSVTSVTTGNNLSVFRLFPLSFYDYCKVHNVPEPSSDKDTTVNSVISLFKSDYMEVISKYDYLAPFFDQYVLRGGFRELSGNNDRYKTGQFCSEIFNKVIKQDIPSLKKTRHPELLEKTFLYLCYHSGEILNLTAMSKALNNTPPITLQNYIQFLSDANLIHISNPVTFNGKHIQKPKPKIYITEPAIRSSLLMLGNTDILIGPGEMELATESLVHRHLVDICQRTSTTVNYYKSSSGSAKTVDMVVDSPSGRTLVDVRYSENPHHVDKKDMLYRLVANRNSTINASYLLTKKAGDYNLITRMGHPPIACMPAFTYLYLLRSSSGYEY